MNEALSDEEMEAVIEALAQGSKIGAIKIYREVSGEGLKQAKEFIEALIPKLVEKDPQKYEQIAKAGGGCAAALVFAAVIIATGAAAFC